MKQAKDFATQSAGETFEMNKAQTKEETSAKLEDQKVVLNIGRSKEKINLKRKLGLDKTGNFLMDAFKKVDEAIANLGKVKTQDKATFFRLLAVMVDAGIPIIKALQTLSTQNKKNKKFQKAIDNMAVQIENGESLSGSMKAYLNIFSEAEIGMIKSGEVSGHLNSILKDLSVETEKNAKTASQVKGAMTYPIVVLSILFLVMFLMMVFVIPNIQSLFEETGAELPAITQFVINLSTFLRTYTIHIILGIIGFVVALNAWKKSKGGKYYWDLFLLNIPILGPLLRKSILAQFSRTISNLLGAGVSIIQSLSIITNAMDNAVYKKKFKFAQEDIKTGIPLAETLKNSKDFPIMLVNMIEIGEQTAQLEDVCKKIAVFYDEQVELAVKNLTKVMEPIIMVFVGIAVGGLVAAIMLPMMSLASVVGG